MAAQASKHPIAGRKMNEEDLDKFRQGLSEIRDELVALRKKVERPEKDGWDKLAAASTLITGGVVALIGIYATWIYNERQFEVHRNQ